MDLPFYKKKTFVLGLFAIVLLSIPFTIYLLQVQQDIRQRAAEISPTPKVCAPVATDTVLVFDRSGSMNSKASSTDRTTKFQAAKTAATTFVNTFPASSPTMLGLTVFASTETSANRTIDHQLSNNYDQLKTIINGLQIDSKSGTCIECAIKNATKELSERGRQGIKKVFVLLTDGRANATITRNYGSNPGENVAVQAALAAAQEAYNQYKVTIYVIGLGSDVNAPFLQQLASMTGGKYYFPGSSEQLNSIYQEIAIALSKGSAQGMIYDDTNANGVQDSTEKGLSGWTVTVKDNAGVAQSSAVSDEYGTYTVSNLCDGSYTASQTMQSGWRQTQPANNAGQPVNITNGSSVDNINFGNTKQARCSDSVDNDNNGYTDSKDSSCHTDGNPDNPQTYDPDKNGENGGGDTCADSKDNNGNNKIDGADPVCHTDRNSDNPQTYDPNLPEITLKADLTVTGMKITYDSQGDNFVCASGIGLLVTFKNQGEASATGSFAVKANNTAKTYSGGLTAGNSASLWINDYVNGAQNIAIVDANNQIDESNETNNQLSSMLPIPTMPIECVPTPTPTPLPPSVTFSANPVSVDYNGSSTLTWSTTNATACTAGGDWSGDKNTSGTQSTGGLTENSTYTLTCSGPGGSTTKSVTVNVGAKPTPLPPSLTFSGNPVNVAYNGSSTLIWSATNATSCTASGSWSGSKELSGTQTINNLTNPTYVYTLTCYNESSKNTSKSVIISVAEAPTNTPVPPSSTPVPPLATSLNLNVLLHGIGSSGDNANPASSLSTKDPLHKDRDVLVEIFKDNNELLVTKEAVIKYASDSGDFKGTVDLGTVITQGNYTIKIKSPQYLRNVYAGIQTLKPGTIIDMTPISLVTGDVNSDNKLNILDYNTLYGCYTSDLMPVARSCDDEKKVDSDLNDEGRVNMYDLNLFIRELSVQSGL